MSKAFPLPSIEPTALKIQKLITTTSIDPKLYYRLQFEVI